MFATLCQGENPPSWSRCALLAVLAVVVASCSESPPTEPASEREPGRPEATHLPWTGCQAWNGISFATVYFVPGSATLDDGDRALLDANIVLLNECPGDGFHVQGEAVREKKARQVAAARAQAVADYYRDNGVLNPDRMDVTSYVVSGCGKVWGPCSEFRSVVTY